MNTKHYITLVTLLSFTAHTCEAALESNDQMSNTESFAHTNTSLLNEDYHDTQGLNMPSFQEQQRKNFDQSIYEFRKVAHANVAVNEQKSLAQKREFDQKVKGWENQQKNDLKVSERQHRQAMIAKEKEQKEAQIYKTMNWTNENELSQNRLYGLIQQGKKNREAFQREEHKLEQESRELDQQLKQCQGITPYSNAKKPDNDPFYDEQYGLAQKDMERFTEMFNEDVREARKKIKGKDNCELKFTPPKIVKDDDGNLYARLGKVEVVKKKSHVSAGGNASQFRTKKTSNSSTSKEDIRREYLQQFETMHKKIKNITKMQIKALGLENMYMIEAECPAIIVDNENNSPLYVSSGFVKIIPK